VKNYTHFAMEVADLKPTESAVDKAKSRFAAERSIRNAVSPAVTLGATIYRPFATTGKKPHPDDEIAAFITKAEGCNDLRLVHSSFTLNYYRGLSSSASSRTSMFAQPTKKVTGPWIFFRDNIPRVAAVAVLFAHVKKDITCSSETSCCWQLQLRTSSLS